MSPAKCGVWFPALGVDSSARRGAWVSPLPRLLPETPDDAPWRRPRERAPRVSRTRTRLAPTEFKAQVAFKEERCSTRENLTRSSK